jgi:hypothetical protein
MDAPVGRLLRRKWRTKGGIRGSAIFEWFDLPQCRSLGISVTERMATFLYRCPDTGFRVQGYTRGQTSDDDDAYEAVTCIACTRVHLVNPTTGKVMGEEE